MKRLMERVYWPVAVAALVALQALLVLVHQPWMDEWQAALIAMLSPDFGALLDNLHYEGHPPLWYLILQIAALAVPPMWVLAAVQLVIATATQLLILLRLQLPRLERFLVGAGYFALIEFGSLSRSLGLGVLLMLLIATTKAKPLRWAAIILLPMVDFQFGLLSIIAIAYLWRAGDRPMAGLILWLASSLAAAWTVLPAPDMVQAMPMQGLAFDFIQAVTKLSALLVPFHFWPGTIDWADPWIQPAGVLMGLLFIAFADWMVHHNRFDRLLFHAFLWACILFASFIYPFGVRHMTLIAWLLILLVARQYAKGFALHPLFRLWLVIGAVMGLWGAVTSLNRPFNNAETVASIIRDKGLQDELLVSWPTPTGSPLAVQLGQELGSLEKQCTQSFHRWDKAEVGLSAQKLGAAVNAFGAKHGRFYIIAAIDMALVEQYAPIKRIASVPAGFDDYAAHIYVVSADGWPPTAKLPRCAPERLRIEDLR